MQLEFDIHYGDGNKKILEIQGDNESEIFLKLAGYLKYHLKDVTDIRIREPRKSPNGLSEQCKDLCILTLDIVVDFAYDVEALSEGKIVGTISTFLQCLTKTTNDNLMYASTHKVLVNLLYFPKETTVNKVKHDTYVKCTDKFMEKYTCYTRKDILINTLYTLHFQIARYYAKSDQELQEKTNNLIHIMKKNFLKELYSKKNSEVDLVRNLNNEDTTNEF